MQGLGNRERKFFLGIAEGKITYRPNKDSEKTTYDFVEGRITGISRRDATINDKNIKFYEIGIENGGNNFVLSVPMDGSVARGIILQLASVQNFAGTTVRISPWLKDTYTNVSVYANGQKLNWAIDPKDLPPVKMVVVGNKEYPDDSERMALVEKLVSEIVERIAAESVEGAGVVDYEEPAPAGPVYNDGLDNGQGPMPDYGPGVHV